MRCTASNLKFESVAKAFLELSIQCESDNERNILVWSDSLNDSDLFENLKPWQVINRIPSANVLCRKASLAFLMKRAKELCPEEYADVAPETFIFPSRVRDARKFQIETGKKLLFKPDGGSLGQGISMVEQGWIVPHRLGVAQEYIPSYLINNRKFDLRVYVLVASVSPLRVCVYRDGVARFCSEDVDMGSMFSRLTNVSLNAQRTGGDFSKISKLISEILPVLESDGVDIDRLWSEIDRAVLLTIVAAHRYLVVSEREFVKACGYPRCFQILGFDILLDERAHPWVLEVNYRPLLDFHRPAERRMKTQMVKDAIRIACPLELVQKILNTRQGFATDEEEWKCFIESHEDVQFAFHASQPIAEATTGFVRVWPTTDLQKRARIKEIAIAIGGPRMEPLPGFMAPMPHVKGGES
jgi:hypothetical protein